MAGRNRRQTVRDAPGEQAMPNGIDTNLVNAPWTIRPLRCPVVRFGEE